MFAVIVRNKKTADLRYKHVCTAPPKEAKEKRKNPETTSKGRRLNLKKGNNNHETTEEKLATKGQAPLVNNSEMENSPLSRKQQNVLRYRQISP